MATLARKPIRKTRTQVTNLAELLHQLGDISPERIRMRPAPGTATEDDITLQLSHSEFICELIDGVLVEKAVGARESLLASVIIQQIANYLDEHDLGIVLGEHGALRLQPGLVLIPDVCFISWRQIPGRVFPEAPFPDLYPDLAVEVLSKSNTAREMERKVREYFASGTRLVWMVDPRERTVQVFTRPDRCRTLSEDDVLEGGRVLPGFRLEIRKLLDKARQNPIKPN